MRLEYTLLTAWRQGSPSAGMPMQEGTRAETTRERRQQVHDLREKGHRTAGVRPPAGPVPEHGQALRPGQRARTAAARPEVPAHPRRPLPRLPAQAPRGGTRVPVQQLLREIRELGYQGSSNLLVRYINQGRLRRPAAPVAPPGHPAPAHQARPPHRRPAETSPASKPPAPR